MDEEVSDPFPIPLIDEPKAEPAVRPSVRDVIGKRKKSHAKKTEGPSTAAATAGAKKVREDRKLDVLKAEAKASLVKFRSEIYAGGMMIVPVPATYVGRTDDEVLDAMVRLAGRNARFLAGLASGGDLLAVIMIGRWCAGLGVATGVQFGRLAPDSKLAETFGVRQIVDELASEGFLEVVAADQPEGIPSSDASPAEDEPSRAGASVVVGV